MKEKVVQFLNAVKDAFTRKQNDMGKLKHHQPFVSELDKDASTLEQASTKISLLDENIEKSYRPTLIFLMIELVVPIFRKWQTRFSVINQKQQADNHNHIKAFSEFSARKDQLFELIDEINGVLNEKLVIPIDTQPPAGRAIIKAYDKQAFKEQFEIQGDCNLQSKSPILK